MRTATITALPTNRRVADVSAVRSFRRVVIVFFVLLGMVLVAKIAATVPTREVLKALLPFACLLGGCVVRAAEMLFENRAR